jgi:hypothetical protein
LDHRAATLEKLGQLQQALKDAKHMIDQKPGLAKVSMSWKHVLFIAEEVMSQFEHLLIILGLPTMC